MSSSARSGRKLVETGRGEFPERLRGEVVLFSQTCLHNLSNPKPGHTTGGTVQGSAKRGGGAGQDRAGPDAAGSVRPGHNRPLAPHLQGIEDNDMNDPM